MPNAAIDHIYRETSQWRDSLAWWEKLGFRVVERWGEEPHRAGKLRYDDVIVVLAETSDTNEARQSVFITMDELDSIAQTTGRDIVNTHWGSTMVSVEDPDGRTYNFELRNEAE